MGILKEVNLKDFNLIIKFSLLRETLQIYKNSNSEYIFGLNNLL